MITFRKLQDQNALWVACNFGPHPAWHSLLGIVEEVGELSHAYLKREQRIRTNQNHNEAIRDAVADIVIYLADFCTTEGIDLGDQVDSTWREVRKRDWKRDAANGGAA